MLPEELEAFNREHVLGQYFDGGFRLFIPQAEGLAAYEQYGCLFGPIGVGFGKTLLSLMIAAAAWRKGLRKILLLVPPSAFPKLQLREVPSARVKVDIPYPIHYLDGNRPAAARRALCASKRNGLYIMAYSLLSTSDCEGNLLGIAPQIVIADEAHRLARDSAARTRRVMRMIEKQKPELIILSGTATGKSLKDYHHLIKHSLGDLNPLPNPRTMMVDWSLLVDASASAEGAPPVDNGKQMILPLVAWANEKFFPDTFAPDVFGFRAAYKKRLHTAPGVVSTGDMQIGTSLVMNNQPVVDYEKTEGYPKLKQLIDDVVEKWLTPNGDEIEHAIHTWKWLNELVGAGFYNELTWLTPTHLAERRRISEAEAADQIDRAKAHHAAGQSYYRELRNFLLCRSKPGIDTPFLCGLEMARNGDAHVGRDLYELWSEWKGLEFDGMPERDSRAVRVCPFKVNAAVDWVRGLEKGIGAIVWYYHQEVGVWLTELLSVSGLNPLYCPSGVKANATIIDPIYKNRIVVASIPAHYEDRNLQHFQHQYIVEWPRAAKMAEQLLGRTHRSGQEAEELRIVTNHTLFFDQINFAACLNDALYIHQTMGNQKLIYADYDPLPKIFPPAVLRERGLEALRLDREQQTLMKEKFGEYS